MKQQTRARNEHAKEARAQAILDAARQLCATSAFPELTMAQVAQAAGLAKGTVFLYFPTKEALGLALVERLLSAWFDDVDARLNALPTPATPAGVAALMAASVQEQRELVRLLPLLGSILEHNIDAATALRFKHALLGRISSTGARLEQTLPFLARGDGLRVVLLVHALVVGLQQMAEPAPVVQQALATPELSVLRVDLVQELELAVQAHLEGRRVLHERGLERTS